MVCTKAHTIMALKKKKRMATSNATTAKVDYWHVTACCEFSNHANCY